MVKDTVSNLIISLKNASISGKEVIAVPFSNISENILNVLKERGYVEEFSVNDKKPIKHIDVKLSYSEDGEAKIHDVKRISKLSKRIYKGRNEIRKVKNGYGMIVMTTPLGVLAGESAREKNVGGEALFEIW